MLEKVAILSHKHAYKLKGKLLTAMQLLWNTSQANLYIYIVGEQSSASLLKYGLKNFQNKKLLGHLLKTGLNPSHKSMRINSYYVCSFCAVNQWFTCSVWYEIMKCYMQTTILHIHSAEEVRPKAKSQVKLKPKSQQKPKAKWACKWKILAPKCSQKPEATSRRSQKPKSNQKKANKNTPPLYIRDAHPSNILPGTCSLSDNKLGWNPQSMSTKNVF